MGVGAQGDQPPSPELLKKSVEFDNHLISKLVACVKIRVINNRIKINHMYNLEYLISPEENWESNVQASLTPSRS